MCVIEEMMTGLNDEIRKYKKHKTKSIEMKPLTSFINESL